MLRFSSYLQIAWSAEFVDSLIRIWCSSFCSIHCFLNKNICTNFYVDCKIHPTSLPACLSAAPLGADGADGGGLKGESVDYNF